MANRLSGNNKHIDTFGSDVTISTNPIYVVAIIATGYSSAKSVVFIDNDDDEVLGFEVPAGGSGQFTPAQAVYFRNGFIFDDSASDLEAGDKIHIYLRYP
jgi:hypothetical protein